MALKHLIVLVYLFTGFCAFTQDYYPVYDFGNDGISSIDLGPPATMDYGICAIRDDNGNYYIGGYTGGTSNVIFSVTKVLPNGQKDPSYGNNGYASIDVPNYGQEIVRGICLQSDGKIVFVGDMYRTTTKGDGIVGRFLQNGQIDSSFNSIGYFIYNHLNFDEYFTSVKVQSDGKIVVGGSVSTAQYLPKIFVCRLTANGVFDNSFATNGKLIYTDQGNIVRLKIQNDDKIVVCGHVKQTNNRSMISRILSNGVLDNTFATNGLFSTNPYTNTNTINDFAILPNGDYLAVSVGANTSSPPVAINSVLFKVSSAGVLDVGYGSGGYQYINEPGWRPLLSTLFLRADGSSLLAGYSGSNTSGETKAMFCEVNALGELNTQLGVNGFISYNPTVWYEYFHFIYEDAEGVVCAGWHNTSSSESNLLITKNIKCTPSSSTVNATTCSSYTIGENTFTQSGTYNVVLRNANNSGCDSTVTLNLTVAPLPPVTLNVSTCTPYTWTATGLTYAQSGTYSHTLQSVGGCDSVVSLNLTLQSNSGVDIRTACGSFTWINGVTYTASTNAPTWNLINQYGCDSTVVLNLTINSQIESNVYVSSCESYTWAQNEQTYTLSGIYVDTVQNSVGCDSVIKLNLTINQPTVSVLTESACESYTWEQNEQTYTLSGIYYDTVQSSVGCDSIIALNLTINQPTGSNFTESACTSYTWLQNEQTYTLSGIYYDTVQNNQGCDSIIALNLTINPSPIVSAVDNGDGTISASNGDIYQWINCESNSEIIGAVNGMYEPIVNGIYAVVVTDTSGCSDTSDCVLIDYLGLNELETGLIAYPNPTFDKVKFTFKGGTAFVEMFDVQGCHLQTITVHSGDEISLGTLVNGLYYLHYTTEGRSGTIFVTKID